MIQPAVLIEREAAGGHKKIQHLPLPPRFEVIVAPGDVAKWTMGLMKLEVVGEVYAEMMLTLKMLLLLLLLLLLEIKGAVIAACIFTISTNHYNTIQA